MTIQTSGFAKLAAIALFAGATLVQGAEQGTFHLPFQARWGQAVLAPGDYSLRWPTPSAGNWQVRVITAEGKTVYELPMYSELTSYSDSNTLTLTNVNGQYVATKLSIGAAGKNYGFAVPKSMRRLSSAISADKLALAIH